MVKESIKCRQILFINGEVGAQREKILPSKLIKQQKVGRNRLF